jgi:hypothetical protein
MMCEAEQRWPAAGPTSRHTGFLTSLLLALLSGGVLGSDAPVTIGSRRELFVEPTLIETMQDRVRLQLHHPTPREISLEFDQPWEGNASGYATVIQDGDLYRMYYRGHRYRLDPPPLREAQPEVVCYAESHDGVTWVRPQLGLFDWPPTQDNSGRRDNNIIWRGGPETHNFAPFLDSRPDCPADERFKAVGGTTASNGLLSFKSADGIHWTRLSAEPVVTKGAFDSHNTVFWDADRQCYVMYVRYFSEGLFKGYRSIGVAHSADFRGWSEPAGIAYQADSPPQHMYTNGTGPYYRAPHLLLGFPTRFVSRPMSRHAEQLEPVDARAKFAASIRDSGAYTGAEITDGLLMASRDGVRFHRWDEAFLRPGDESAGRWIYGDNYQSYGLFETRSESPGHPPEISMHFNEGAWRDDMHRLRRYALRVDGFVSLQAPLSGGRVTTRPLIFAGSELTLNYASRSCRPTASHFPGSPRRSATNCLATPWTRSSPGRKTRMSRPWRDGQFDCSLISVTGTCTRSSSACRKSSITPYTRCAGETRPRRLSTGPQPARRESPHRGQETDRFE